MIIINKTAMALISSPETYSERNLEIAIDGKYQCFRFQTITIEWMCMVGFSN